MQHRTSGIVKKKYDNEAVVQKQVKNSTDKLKSNNVFVSSEKKLFKP